MLHLLVRRLQISSLQVIVLGGSHPPYQPTIHSLAKYCSCCSWVDVVNFLLGHVWRLPYYVPSCPARTIMTSSATEKKEQWLGFPGTSKCLHSLESSNTYATRIRCPSPSGFKDIGIIEYINCLTDLVLNSMGLKFNMHILLILCKICMREFWQDSRWSQYRAKKYFQNTFTFMYKETFNSCFPCPFEIIVGDVCIGRTTTWFPTQNYRPPSSKDLSFHISFLKNDIMLLVNTFFSLQKFVKYVLCVPCICTSFSFKPTTIFFIIYVHSHDLMYENTAATSLANFSDDTAPTQTPCQNPKIILFFTVFLHEYLDILTYLWSSNKSLPSGRSPSSSCWIFICVIVKQRRKQKKCRKFHSLRDCLWFSYIAQYHTQIHNTRIRRGIRVAQYLQIADRHLHNKTCIACINFRYCKTTWYVWKTIVITSISSVL